MIKRLLAGLVMFILFCLVLVVLSQLFPSMVIPNWAFNLGAVVAFISGVIFS
jgi:hypothetical protein